jgi:hypothetical protein
LKESSRCASCAGAGRGEWRRGTAAQRQRSSGAEEGEKAAADTAQRYGDFAKREAVRNAAPRLTRAKE